MHDLQAICLGILKLGPSLVENLEVMSGKDIPLFKGAINGCGVSLELSKKTAVGNCLNVFQLEVCCFESL